MTYEQLFAINGILPRTKWRRKNGSSKSVYYIHDYPINGIVHFYTKSTGKSHQIHFCDFLKKFKLSTT